MKILDIALKDLVRSLRSAMGLVFMFGVPLLVNRHVLLHVWQHRPARWVQPATDQGGHGQPGSGGPRFQAGPEISPERFNAETHGRAGGGRARSEDLAELAGGLGSSRTRQQRNAAVDSQQAQVAIIIPEDFSDQFADLNGQASIEFYQDPTLTIGPGIVKSILNQFMDGMSGVKIAVDVAMGDGETPTSPVGQVVQEYLDTSNTQTDDPERKAAGGALCPGQKPATECGAESQSLNIVGPPMGAMMIFYAFYTGTATAESIFARKKNARCRALFTTPTPQATILGGKFLSVFLTVVVQVVVLITAGRLIFGIRWGALEVGGHDGLRGGAGGFGFGVFINSFLKDPSRGASFSAGC